MISVVLWIPDCLPATSGEGQAIVARSLPWLVSAVVAGVVRDLTLAAPTALELARLAERVGCGLAEADRGTERLRVAVDRCREDRILVLRAGHQPTPGIIDELAHANVPPGTGLVLLGAAPPWWKRLRSGRRAIVGVLAMRQQCLVAEDFDDLVHRHRRAPCMSTRAEALA
jgi:hypothetical protein